MLEDPVGSCIGFLRWCFEVQGTSTTKILRERNIHFVVIHIVDNASNICHTGNMVCSSQNISFVLVMGSIIFLILGVCALHRKGD